MKKKFEELTRILEEMDEDLRFPYAIINEHNYRLVERLGCLVTKCLESVEELKLQAMKKNLENMKQVQAANKQHLFTVNQIIEAHQIANKIIKP